MYRKTTRHQSRTIVIGSVLLALVLTACSGSGGSSPESQVLRVALPVPPITLDPHGAQAVEDGVQTISQHFLDPLVRFHEGEHLPALAESWDNPDPLTWVFSLREGTTFSDGTPLTAADVKASAERVIALESAALSPLWAPVTSIEATDDLTVTITTEEPLGTLISTVSLLYVGPADRIDDDDFWRAPVGTGPFVVEEFVPDERVTLSANDTYWAGSSDLDELQFLYIPEVSGRITALQTGEVDVVVNIPPDQVGGVQSDGLVYETTPSNTYYFNWFNSSREPFSDERVRQALWYAVDIESTVEDLFGDMATVAEAPIPQNVFGAPSLDPYPYDPEQAGALLAEAGYADGFSASLQFPRDSGPNIRALAQALVSHWAAVGVEVEPLEKERAQWIDDLNALNWDINLQTNTVLTGDADYALGRLYLCAAERNGFCSEELDAHLLEGRASVDPDARVASYREASQIIWDSAVGIFPMDLSTNVAYRDSVQNLQLRSSGHHWFYGVSLSD